MRLCCWVGVARLLPLLFFLVLLSNAANVQNKQRERHYYIAAVQIDWDYSANGQQRSGPSYKKVVFREYEEGFKQAKTHPSWLGLVGPTLRGQVNEDIVVTFRNMADRHYSIHPHGIAYGKQSEGALYFDNTSQHEKEDDAVPPGSEHTYYWDVTSEVAPKADDPTCLTYIYQSHIDVIKDYNSGLIGTLLICKEGSLGDSGEQVEFYQEYVLLFGVFDERYSWNKPSDTDTGSHVKHTINGYTNGSVPGLSVCAHASVSLHLVGMSSEPELFSVHINGQVLQQAGHRVSAVGLISGTATSASMTAVYPGRWLLSSHISNHLEAGLHGFVDVRTCEDIEPPTRKLTIQQKRESQEWRTFIAAEEIVWDYAPQMPEYIDKDFESKYLKQGPNRIGKKYKKVVYRQYTDATFTVRAENKQRKTELGIIGPVIRAQIRDVIKIVFKNMASRPYSIYPHGLTIDKSAEGANYPEGGNQTHGVQPGETHTYVWKVIDEPSPTDSRCLTRMYHSAVNTPRDIASGLMGPLLICKSQSLNMRNVQTKADKEQHAMFSIFDENKSWYLNDNIRSYCETSNVKKEDPEFYKSNVMHTINGYVFESGQLLGFCYGEVVTWHVSSVGAQDHIQTATFYGHTFNLNDRREDFLSLFPMTGETVTVYMDNTGVWLLASLNSHETTKGMRVKFQDVECTRDFVYEYEDEDETDTSNPVSIWTPLDLDTAKEKMKEPVVSEKKVVEIDAFTEMYMDMLGLRSLKKQSGDSELELLDLSDFDYDVDDMHGYMDVNENANHTSNAEMEKMGNVTNQSLGPSPGDSQTNSSLADTQVIDRHNLTTKMLNENSSENTTGALNYSTNQLGFSLNISSGLNNTTVRNTSLSIMESNITETNIRESNITESNITESNIMESNITETNIRESNITESNITESNITSAATNHTYVTVTNTSTVQLNISSERENVTQIKEKQAYVNTTLKEEAPKHSVNRGDVFSYSVPLPRTPSNTSDENEETEREDFVLLDRDVNMESATDDEPIVQDGQSSSKNDLFVSNISLATASPYENGTALTVNATFQSELSENAINQSEHIINAEFRESEVKQCNMTNFDLDIEGNNNMTSVNCSLGTITIEEYGHDTNSSEATLTPANATTGAVEYEKNEEEYGTFSDIEDVTTNTSSIEEVVIYLQNNNSEVFRTSSVDLQGKHWAYEGTETMVPMEMPDHMIKYTGNEPPKPSPIPKIKTVYRRQRPQKGHAMKTKKKKEYKPQHPNKVGFSPRGFNPLAPGFSPRGARPISSEEDLTDTTIIIGVPRTGFSDYDFYVPDSESGSITPNENIAADVGNEYEYVHFKDPYSDINDVKSQGLDADDKYLLKSAGENVRTYFITAEEVQWDYAGYGQRRMDKSDNSDRPTEFTKVVFREYLDSKFSKAVIRGEMEEHLGVLGPLIKAEVGQTIMVFFRNRASRPYSLHPNGVSYTKKTEGLKYEDESTYWFKYDNEVQPNSSYTYLWEINTAVGPTKDESDCRTWAYYSGVNPERDINSGLIGPLLVCRKGTLSKKTDMKMDMREFVLLFMTFDESQSWYYKKNLEMLQRKSRRAEKDPNKWSVKDTNFRENLKFHAINGIIFSLKGLRMYTNQMVRWHLINMGSPRDLHSVHFHGQTFLHKQTRAYRQGVYPLLPGGFATLEMLPSKPGLWQLETEVGLNQQRGMQTLFLVLDNKCNHPLGLISGSVKDNHIFAPNHRGYWEASLARLHNQGQYNAWSTEEKDSWIQVDFQRPVVISEVDTQGAKERFYSHYVINYTISYSTDRKKWNYYKGDSTDYQKVFTGNEEAYEVKKNTFFPPLIGRFVRLHPLHYYNSATVRMEFYGCQLDGCSVPLGMESRRIEDHRITASSTATSWYSGPWQPSLARLNKQGTINAWQAKYTDMNQWLQVELAQVKKITGIVTQGAKSLGKEMFVIEYALEYSDDGTRWNKYTDDADSVSKIFPGNSNNNDHVKNYIYPPIFSRFIRIIPKNWKRSITMRIELLGCDFE